MSGYATTGRSTGGEVQTGTYRLPSTGSPHSYSISSEGVEAKLSRSNPRFFSSQRGRRESDVDTGSIFQVSKVLNDPGTVWMIGSGTRPNVQYTIDGPVSPVYAVMSWPVSLSDWVNPLTGWIDMPDSSGLDALGATAISRCAPTNPHAATLTALGELKNDGLPSLVPATLKGRDRGTIKGASDDYLNYQFALAPMAQDISDVYTAVRDRGKVLSQYARDSGKPVRRTYGFPDIISTTETTLASTTETYPWLAGDFISQRGVVKKTVSSKINTWFSGSFVYHRAGNDTQWKSILQKYQDMNHLLGTGSLPLLGTSLPGPGSSIGSATPVTS